MALKDVTRKSLEYLNQNIRLPGVQPGAVPPGRGKTAVQDANYASVDEFLRIIPFYDVEEMGGPYARQYQVITSKDIDEPEFTYRGVTRTWAPGTTTPFGIELDTVGTRFHKISLSVRSDTYLGAAPPEDVHEAQIELARIGILRALSESLLYSDPPDDDGADLAGIPFYLPANSPQVVNYSAQHGLMAGLSEIEARCCPGDDGLGKGPDIFLMSTRARWRLLKELEDKGVTPDFNFCEFTGKNQLHYHGVPVLTGRVPESNDINEGSFVYAMKITGPSAVMVLHIGGDDFGVRIEAETSTFGLDAQGEANNATMGIEVLGIYSILVPDSRSVALLRGVPVADPITQP